MTYTIFNKTIYMLVYDLMFITLTHYLKLSFFQSGFDLCSYIISHVLLELSWFSQYYYCDLQGTPIFFGRNFPWHHQLANCSWPTQKSCQFHLHSFWALTSQHQGVANIIFCYPGEKQQNAWEKIDEQFAQQNKTIIACK